ncbi:MAG: SDR family oxidoreductase [Deltaproteobacteria bacterium]|nr:SDR family oxidoreductase [Deltaproteobacteria bacterium]
MSVVPTKVKNKELVAKRREQIVLAAIKLFSRKGFHESNLRELAEESGISHGNIYDYVGSKQDIFFLIHEFINNIALEESNRSIENIDDPLEKLRRMLKAEFKLMHEWSDAILLLFQETHILDKRLMKALLRSERGRVRKLEELLEESINKGQLRKFNTRVAANLIKSMAEAWVVKRWDLRGYIDRTEMEKAILDVAFNGLLKRKAPAKGEPREIGDLQGRSVLLLNGESLLAKAISFSLLTRGARLAIQTSNGLGESREYPIPAPERWQDARIYSSKKYGQLTTKLFNKIVNDFGHIDIIIHDLGIKTEEAFSIKRKRSASIDGLRNKLCCAQDLASSIEKRMRKSRSGKLLYLAPWAWDKFVDPLRYETVKACAEALTREMAQAMSDASVNVNCIIPGFIGGVRPLNIEKKMSSLATEETPMGYLGEISDVLDAVWFLISDKSKYVTGQVLRVTGGIG